MLTYTFTDTGSDSLYLHLYKCMKQDMLDGVLVPGTKLPSKRSFAKNLGLSTITVETAYEQLQSEGYIYSLPRKGFYVAELSEFAAIKPVSIRTFVKAEAPSPCYVADFVSNQVNPDNFPFTIWTKLLRETISNQQDELMLSPPCGGIMELRSAICRHLKQFRNMEIEPEQIIVGAGTEYLYGLLIQLLGYDKIYAVENPGYQKIAKIYQSNQVTCRHITVAEDGIRLSELEDSLADVVHLSPSHHYPTGIVTPIGKRYELLGWASKSDSRYIIEDDYDSEFRLTGKPIPTLQSIDVMEKVIYMNTFTKSLSSTIRISYMVLPPSLLQQFYERLSFYSCTVSNFEQYTLARFLSEGYFEKHINRMRNYYRGIRDELLSTIKRSPLSSLCRISEEDAGLHFLMHIKASVSDAKLLERARKSGLHISCLSQYYFDPSAASQEHILILNYSALKIESIETAVELLYHCIS